MRKELETPRNRSAPAASTCSGASSCRPCCRRSRRIYARVRARHRRIRIRRVHLGQPPFKTEITPLLIVIKLEQYDYDGAAALGFFMLAMSFVMLFAINLVQGWGQRRLGIGVGR